MTQTNYQQLPAALHAPHVEQYFGAVAMHEPTFLAIFDRVARMDLRVHVSEQNVKAEGGFDGGGRSYGYPVADNGIAIFQLNGMMMKHVGSMQDGTSTVMLRRTLRAARANNAVAGGILVIDSPGGMCAGTLDLAEDVAAFAAKKPLHVFVDGMCCSAAMWVASQGAVISAGPDAIVGSIGTYMPVYDFSKWAENEGISVTVIKEGDHKGDGTLGTKITDEMKLEWKRTISALNGHFVKAIGKGLGISADRAKELNDGRVHVGAEAKREGLVHHLENFDAAFARLEKAIDDKRNGRATKARADESIQNPKAEIENAGPADSTHGGDKSTAEAVERDGPAHNGAEASTESGASALEKGTAMSQNTTAPNANASESSKGDASANGADAPKPASMAELKAACPGASSDFLVEQMEKGATVASAKDAYIAHQAAEIGKLKAAETLKPAASEAAAPVVAPAASIKKPGVPALASAAAEQASGGDDAIATYESRVKTLTDAGMSRSAASQKVLGGDEQLRQDYLAARRAK